MSMPDDCDADCGDEAPDPEPGCGEDEGSGSSEGGGGGGGSSEGGEDTGCCTHWNCVYDGTTYQYTATWSEERSEADCIMPITEFSGDPSIPCNSTPLNLNNNYNTWSPEPCLDPCESANCGARRYKWVYGNVFANPYYSGGSWALTSGCNASGDDYICSPSNSNPPGPILGSCGGAFAAYHTWLCSEFGEIPGVDCQASGPHEIIGSGPCFDVDCTCESSVGGLSVPSDRPVEVTERPCYQEECETHVSTWMAEPFGEPNEEGLYKVKWILLDDCPGACCSDQPTQPEFVKKSELIDAPCKCGCN